MQTILKTFVETVFTSVDIGVSLHLELIIGKYFRRIVLKTDQNIQMYLSNLLANLKTQAWTFVAFVNLFIRTQCQKRCGNINIVYDLNDHCSHIFSFYKSSPLLFQIALFREYVDVILLP